MFSWAARRSFSCSIAVKSWSPEVLVTTMGFKRLSESRHGVTRVCGVRLAVFYISLVFLGMVKFGVVDAQVVQGRPPSLRAPAPSAIPPPPPLTPLQQSQEAVRAMRANNLTTAAQLIQTYLPVLRLNSTLFVPTNEALAAVSAGAPILTLLLYHAARPQYNFDQLVTLPIGTRLETALGRESVIITNNDRSNCQVDHVRIVVPDACSSGTTNLEISCHGVEAVLNATRYGKPTSAPSPAPVGVPTAAPVSAFAPLFSSPPVPFILPGTPAIPIESPEGEIPVAQSPTTSTPTGGALACSVRPPFRQLAYFVFLGVMSIGFGL